MEPRARAGKNVGKMNFSHNELAQLLYAHGDVKTPLPDTIRVLDEIVTDFIQSVSFDATRAAHHSGRQKVKFEDFEFAMRKNPLFMGKVQDMFEKKREIDRARNVMAEEKEIMRDANREEKEAQKGKEKGAGKDKDAAMSAAGAETQTRERVEEELGEADDDVDAEMDALGSMRK